MMLGQRAPHGRTLRDAFGLPLVIWDVRSSVFLHQATHNVPNIMKKEASQGRGSVCSSWPLALGGHGGPRGSYWSLVGKGGKGEGGGGGAVKASRRFKPAIPFFLIVNVSPRGVTRLRLH